MTFFHVLTTEFLKLRRTKITWILGATYCVGPLMMSLMMLILKNPDLARKMGLLATKAELMAGTADWPTYLSLVPMILMAGMIVLGIVEAFVFGREYAEGTAKNMLTLPIPRGTFVAAKLAVAAVWFVVMYGIVYVESIILGFLIGLPGFSAHLLLGNAVVAGRLAWQVLLLGSVPAWIAIIGRGYLAPVGFAVFALLLGNLFAHTGWGPWFPWSIVLITADATGQENPAIGIGSVVVLLVLFIGCAIGAFISLDRADNTQ